MQYICNLYTDETGRDIHKNTQGGTRKIWIGFGEDKSHKESQAIFQTPEGQDKKQ